MKRRVLVTLTDLYGGGAQRVVLTLLEHLPRDRFELHLALVECRGQFLDRVPPDVPVHDLGKTQVHQVAWPLLRLVRELRPQVVFSTLYHLNQFLLLLRPFMPRGTRLVVREGITVGSALRRNPRPLLRWLLFRTIYRSADRIVCQCEYMRDDLAQRFGVPRHKMEAIYNPLDAEMVRARAEEAANPFAGRGPGPHLVAAGRLTPQKGFDDLMRAFPALQRLFPAAQLWILGEDTSHDGRFGRELVVLRRELGLEEQVHFTGFVPDPYGYFAHADLFVLSSRYEGLPNVLLEALACGCPVVALDRPGGTREVMELTGQTARLRQELDWQREWFRGQGQAPAVDLRAFSLSDVTDAYAKLLAEV